MNALTASEMAIRYAAIGWLVIPVEGKKPVGNEWQKRASCDQAAVARLFACPHDGVGVLLGQRSNLIDFDCDSESAEETLARLFDGHEVPTPSFQSTRGRHVLFRWTDKLPQGSIKLVIDGLEIRLGNGSLGCQTVFPPSGSRAWLIDPDDCPLAEIPEAVIERINARYTEIHKPKAVACQLNYQPASERTDALNVPRWLAKHGREIIGRTDGSDGTSRWHIVCPGVERHTTANSFRDCCVTQAPSGMLGGGCFHASCGMANWELLKSEIGALEYSDFHDDQQYAGVDISRIIDPIPEAITKKIEPVNPTAMNESFYEIPGLIGDMIAYHREFAPRPRPELSLVASIALMGAITGRKIQTKSGMRTNIYCIGLAPSGSGKEKPRNNNIMALTDAGLVGYLGSENPASDAALIGELEDNPALLIQIDEVSRYFATLKSQGSGSVHLKNIQTRFLELTGAAENPAWIPKGWADKGKKKVICHPHLCIYGTSTADGFWGSVASSDAVDGFLARMMIVECDPKYPRLREIESAKTPQNVIDVIKAWSSFRAGPGDLSDKNPKAVTIHMDSSAADRIKSHSDGVEDRLGDEPDDQKAIWSRSSALAKRLSLIFAASRGPDGIAVTLEDAQAAVRMANWCTRLLIRRVFTHVSANEDDSVKKKVLEIIRRSGELTSNELTRKTQWIKDGRSRSYILAELIEAEYIMQIRPHENEMAGRPITSYRFIASM